MMLASLLLASAMTYAADEQRVLTVTPPLPLPPPTPALPKPHVALNFPKVPASAIIALYKTLIPEELVVDSGINMGVPLTLETKGEVSQEKAVEMIESTLMLNGYTLLQQAPGTIIKAADAVQLFQAQVSPPNSYTSLITVTNANAVLITESTSVIRQLIGMQPSFDVKSQAAKSR